jgi:hypothetical protein
MSIDFLCKSLFLFLLIINLYFKDNASLAIKEEIVSNNLNRDTLLVLDSQEIIVNKSIIQEQESVEKGVNQDSFYVSKTAFNGTVAFFIPSSFSKMSEAMQGIKYPNLKHP